MSQPLWYLREHKQSRVIGPFPAQQVQEFLSNGEITLGWEISLDRQDWLTVLESDQFSPRREEEPGPEQFTRQAWRDERAQARHRWLQDQNDISQAQPRDMATERRTRQALQEDQVETDSLLDAEHRRRPPIIAGLLAILILLGLTYFIWQGQGKESGIQAEIGLVANCAAPLAEAVNWGQCDKRGLKAPGVVAHNTRMERINLSDSDLSGADLSYALLAKASLRNSQLSGINLTGADLTGADLSGANLSKADLRFAVLKDATLDGVPLDGAQLGRAIWPDGHQCAEGAVGQCP